MRLGVFWRFAICGRSRGVALVSASPLSCAYPAVCDTSFYFSCAQGGGEVQGGPRTRRGATSPFYSAGRDGFLFVRRPLGLTSMCRVVPHNPSNSAHRIDWRRLMLRCLRAKQASPRRRPGPCLHRPSMNIAGSYSERQVQFPQQGIHAGATSPPQ
ncbi:hypothetical protein VUR80DRAFT_2415 [Thermomyces stellatus]